MLFSFLSSSAFFTMSDEELDRQWKPSRRPQSYVYSQALELSIISAETDMMQNYGPILLPRPG